MNAVDTNVLIYSCDLRDRQRQSVAIELLGSLSDGVILWQVACEFVAASRKLAPQGFTVAHAWDQLADLLTTFSLIVPQPAVLSRARALQLDLSVSYWDAMLYAACIDAGLQRLYSEDVSGSLVPDLEIVNPFKQS